VLNAVLQEKSVRKMRRLTCRWEKPETVRKREGIAREARKGGTV